VSAYTDQDDIERLKDWWKNYGAALITGVVLGLLLLFGNKYWQHYKESRLVAASELYDQLLQSQRLKQAEAVRVAGEKLVQEYAATPYAGLAALLLAQTRYQAGDVVGAKQHLKWAMEESGSPATGHAARLRLARLLAGAGESEAALALIEVKDKAGFVAEYQELKGDLLVALNRRDEARAVYRDALKHLGSSSYQSVLQMKLDELGPEKNE
jgi:predicted negative regulator of RcsB-dependent stress response